VVHLVTGAAGFIGYHLTRRLLQGGEEVVGIDSLNDYYDPRLKLARLKDLGIGAAAEGWGAEAKSPSFPRLTFIRLSLEDREGMERIFSGRRFDRVCNLAAQAGVRYSLVNPRAYVTSNIEGFLNVLECCRQAATPHLVYASSSSVYGLGSRQPFSTQDRADRPISMYAATKRANELMAHAYSHLYGLPTTGLRFFTVYGPWGRPDMAYYKFARAILENTPIDVFNNGDMQRDFTYIDDVVECIWRIRAGVPSADPVPYRIYNIGNSSPQRLRDFIAALEDALGKKAVCRNQPLQAGDVQSTWADVADLDRDFGWRPTTKIRDGLRHFVEWFLENDVVRSQ
jgi:UDP-glucuronate 4-epimerase